MAIQIQTRRGATSVWNSNNPILAEGEFGYDTTSSGFKIGDGSTTWSGLSYFGGIIDHGNLTGLVDDDHTQYHTDARGDVRYYTETEVDTWRNSVTQTEMGYVNGVSSDIQTQIDTKLSTAQFTVSSGDLQTNIDAKDNYSSWSFAVDGVTKDAITTGDVLDFVGGDNITVTRSADDQITISGAASGVGISNIVEDLSPELGADLDAGQFSIKYDAIPGSDHEAIGEISSWTMGENVVFGDVLYIKTDGELGKSDADGTATMAVICMSIATTVSGSSGEILLSGFVRDDTYTFSIGGDVFASTTAGGVTQTAPVGSGDQVQYLGTATHANRFRFSPISNLAEVA